MQLEIDKKQLLNTLERLTPEKKQQTIDELMRRVSMSSAVPALVGIDHEKEYLLSRQIASHLIGRIHEPEMSELE